MRKIEQVALVGFPRHLSQVNPPSGSQFLQVGEAAQRTAHRKAMARLEQTGMSRKLAQPRKLFKMNLSFP
ncbi:hypothetical protein A6770_20480 [Nostoc minutum NIES-26]|uniref:Uncharacterized protein n=1 Tax=Nostoc minutum NIES-26 TaxID=1844469 RepID=A0A367R3C2_9NOSO|nr:hypothetical protein A6770_20480 [Nostoc minutum NIES-26]